MASSVDGKLLVATIDFGTAYSGYTYSDIDSGTEVETEDSKKVSGLEVLSMALECMKNHLMTSLDRKGMGVRTEDKLWVITVPAVWSHAAKQLTREEAVKGGFHCESLIFSYEPEAAAIYSRLISILSSEEVKSGKPSFKEGKTIMIVDVVGGTADYSVVEIVDEKTVNIVEKATDGPWVGVKINDLFNAFMEDVWGQNVTEALKSRCFSGISS